MNARVRLGRRLVLGLLVIALAAVGAGGSAEGSVDFGVLMRDGLSGNYRNPKEANYVPACVLGSEIPRDHVLSIAFVDSLADAPADAWDVSAAEDGSVLAWATPADAPEEAWGYAYSSAEMGYIPQIVPPEGEYFELTIGAEGGVTVNADGAHLFAAYLNLRSIHTNGCLDTSRVTDMTGMFCEDASLAELDLRGWNTSGAESMRAMFSGCGSLTELDVSGFDTSNVTDFSEMFYQCGNLAELDVSGFNTAKARSMELMFAGCGALEALDLRGFDTSEVANMSHMFWNCAGLTSLDLTSFDTAKAEKMERMFTMAEGLEEILVSGKFIIPEGTDMQAMFYGCLADGLTMI